MHQALSNRRNKKEGVEGLGLYKNEKKVKDVSFRDEEVCKNDCCGAS